MTMRAPRERENMVTWPKLRRERDWETERECFSCLARDSSYLVSYGKTLKKIKRNRKEEQIDTCM